MKKIKVVLSFICYPLTMAHYFWKAFERRDDVELYTVAPYTGNWIPWNMGMYLPQKYVKVPNLPLPQQAVQMKPKTIFAQAQMPDEWQEPDLWVQIDAGFHFADRPKAKKVAHIQTDPHVLKQHYQLPKSYSDFNFCMQSPYLEQGEIFLPYAYDPTIHYPMDLPKEYDACMIGLHYPQRDQLVNKLVNKGKTVHYSIGEVFDEYRETYNKSRIALSWSSLLDTPARVWEAMGMKLPLVCNRTPDLEKFFIDDTNYLGFSNLQEAESQVLLLLSDDDYRKEIAESGYKAVKEHTWDNRVEFILQKVGLV